MKGWDFEELYLAHFNMVYNYALALTRNAGEAEELTQEAFARFLRSPENWRGQGSETTWLCSTVKHLWVDKLRKEGRLRPLEGREEQAGDSFEEKLADEDVTLQIHQILHTLPEPYKEVFSLRVFGELSYEKIALIFGRTPNWARVTYCRAKMKIREELRKEEENHGGK